MLVQLPLIPVMSMIFSTKGKKCYCYVAGCTNIILINLQYAPKQFNTHSLLEEKKGLSNYS